MITNGYKMKYKIDYNIGKVKYLVSYSNGTKKHKDGSEFWDIACFSNKKKMEKFVNQLFVKELKEGQYV